LQRLRSVSVEYKSEDLSCAHCGDFLALRRRLLSVLRAEVPVPEATHPSPTLPMPLNNAVADIFARSADQWFATRPALLADVDALRHAWLHRLRASIDATQQAIQQNGWMPEPEEMLHIHQKWLSSVFSRVKEDIAAFNTSISSIANWGSPDKDL
jgi:hypothetical protein